MSREQFKAKLIHAVGAVCETLHETSQNIECGNSCPESILYLGLGSDLQFWNDVKGLMVASGLIVVKGHAVSIAEKGRKLAVDTLEIKKGVVGIGR